MDTHAVLGLAGSAYLVIASLAHLSIADSAYLAIADSEYLEKGGSAISGLAYLAIAGSAYLKILYCCMPRYIYRTSSLSHTKPAFQTSYLLLGMERHVVADGGCGVDVGWDNNIYTGFSCWIVE